MLFTGGNQKAEPNVGGTTSDGQSEFSNKEIIVQRHGNLVQLIMTPLSSDKIKNGITLEVIIQIYTFFFLCIGLVS